MEGGQEEGREGRADRGLAVHGGAAAGEADGPGQPRAQRPRLHHLPDAARRRSQGMSQTLRYSTDTPSTVYKKHLIRNIVEIIRNLGNID